MTLDLMELTGFLEINDHDLRRFRDQIIHILNDPEEVRKITNQQCKARGKQDCQSCKSEGECRVVNGAANLMLGDGGSAINNLEFANRYFARKDKTWNSIISKALLSLAYTQNGDMRLAISTAQDALSRLEKIFLRIHAKDYPEKAISLKDDLLEFISNPPPPPPHASPPDGQPPKEQIFQRATLAFPSLQVFSGVRAGPDGPIWDQLPKNPKAFVDRIILDDSLHDLYSVSTGNQISINPDKKYGWVKVKGDSMEASKPVAILDGDYVLFSESSDADDGSIVIAAFSDAKGAGYKFVVKRYSKSDGHLISETEPPNKYDHLRIDKNTRIIATVIAVAKSTGNQSSISTQAPPNNRTEKRTQKRSTSTNGEQSPNVTEASTTKITEEVLLQELIVLLGVTGSRGQAERLVKLEQKNSPGINKIEAIRKAILHLVHERQ